MVRTATTSGLSPFKSITPKAISLLSREQVTTSYLNGCEGSPLVIQPATDDVDLVEWTRSNREFIESKLLQYGALLFRNFRFRPLPDFERFAGSLCTELFKDNGEHPRDTVNGNVYTPVFYPADRKVWWHNENSFNHSWPLKIWFCCLQPASQGGETPIADSRKVYELIDPAIRETFIEKQVMYVRNYGEGLGLDWQTVFKTSSRTDVEKICRQNLVDFEWKGKDGLKTLSVRPAVVKYPKTGEMCWFTQAQHWHTACLDAATRAALYSLYREEDLPRACYYGDGSTIDNSTMDAILAVYESLEVTFKWQEGDIMMLDNMLTAHARNSFVGERKLLVAMGEMSSYSEVG
jgi:alpha-ketoglutarate-dependent taurine dioxygenase